MIGWLKILMSLAALCVFLLLFKVWIKPVLMHTHWYLWAYEHIYYASFTSLKAIFTTPYIYIALPVILTLEHLIPAKKDQKIFSVSFAQDFIWFLLDACFQATIIAALSTYWIAIYKEHFNYLTVHSIQLLPYWMKLAIGILMADFGGWLHHFIRHKVVWLWKFHTIHHSQKELNLFTDVRYHVVEYSITAVINVFFIGVCTMDPYTVIYYTMFHSWYTKMCHANIKSNFGPLKYILITPQSHRVHHSIEPRHYDKNMGILLSIWDYIFGTQYRKYDEYPETGVPDETFPHEKDVKGFNLILNPIKQHIYPFQAIIRSLRKGKE